MGVSVAPDLLKIGAEHTQLHAAAGEPPLERSLCLPSSRHDASRSRAQAGSS